MEGTIPRDASLVSHKDKLENYCEGAKRLPVMKLSVKCGEIKRAYLQSPEITGEIELEFKYNNGVAEIVVPESTFAAYALILLEE